MRVARTRTKGAHGDQNDHIFLLICGLPLTRATLSDNDPAVDGKKVLCHDATLAEVIIASNEHGVPPLHAMTLSRSQRKNEEAVV